MNPPSHQPEFSLEDEAPETPAAPATTQRHRSKWSSWARRRATGNGREHGNPLFVSDGQTVIGERFRVLRARIEAAGPGAFMVTSALDQEGKSLCAANLAVTLSMGMGTEVILVDADLRHSSVGAYFGIDGGAGLADCLLGERQWQDCLVATPYDRLRLLPGGRRTAMAPELLASERMQQVTAEMKAQFPGHYLLFDTSPILLTVDPMVVARHMDHVLLVVRAGVTPRTAVAKAIEALGAERFLGIVFNNTTDTVSDYYHYRNHYSYPERNGSRS